MHPSVQGEVADAITYPVLLTLDHGDWEKCLKTREKKISLVSSKGTRRRTQGTAGQSSSTQSLAKVMKN